MYRLYCGKVTGEANRQEARQMHACVNIPLYPDAVEATSPHDHLLLHVTDLLSRYPSRMQWRHLRRPSGSVKAQEQNDLQAYVTPKINSYAR